MIKEPKNKNELIKNYEELINFIKDSGDVYQPHVEILEDLKLTIEYSDDYYNELIGIYVMYTPAMGSYGEGLQPNTIGETSPKLKGFSFIQLQRTFDKKNDQFRNGILYYLNFKGITKEEMEKRDEARIQRNKELSVKKKNK
jgi:hypothetical protein